MKSRVAVPLLAMLAIQVVSGIPEPWYVRGAGGISFEYRVSEVIFTPSHALLNVLHVPVFAILTALWAWALRARKSSLGRAIASAVVISGAFGLVNELSQMYVPTRFASPYDMVYNLIGVCAGGSSFWYACRRGHDA